jgi:hypothetical protein
MANATTLPNKQQTTLSTLNSAAQMSFGEMDCTCKGGCKERREQGQGLGQGQGQRVSGVGSCGRLQSTAHPVDLLLQLQQQLHARISRATGRAVRWHRPHLVQLVRVLVQLVELRGRGRG